MGKFKQDSRFWCCLVICSVPIDGKTITSFMSFSADNRFKAFREIEERLPENPKWLSKNGTLHPYRIVVLHQCKPHETQKYANFYTERLREMYSRAPEGSELEATYRP